MKPYLGHEHPLRFAHRGGAKLWPENTMAAFQGAVDLGYRYIETDVRSTADGVLVAFHDHHLGRLTNGGGRPEQWRWDELRRLDAAFHFEPEQGYPYRGRGLGIPSLEELMTTFPDRMINIDLKQPGIEDLLTEFAVRHGFEDRMLIGSFKDRRIARFRRASSGTIATSAGPAETLALWGAARAGRSVTTPADAFQVPVRAGRLTVIDRRFVAAAHAAGKQVHAWTIDDPAEMRRLLDLGVDGIVTDRPDVLNEVLGIRSD